MPHDYSREEPPMNVMLAATDARTVENLTSALKGCACRVTPARGADECLWLAGREAFDLVLLDLALSGACGCETVIQRLKAIRPETKIITLAADCNRDLERAMRRHGILFYMTKPVAPSLLRELMAHLSKPKRPQDAP
jgi:CheY-like chemotaxis protein